MNTVEEEKPESYERVIRTANGGGMCLICHKVFTSYPKANRHVTDIHTVSDVSERECTICGAVFKNKRYKNEHLRRNHGVYKSMMPASDL